MEFTNSQTRFCINFGKQIAIFKENYHQNLEVGNLISAQVFFLRTSEAQTLETQIPKTQTPETQTSETQIPETQTPETPKKEIILKITKLELHPDYAKIVTENLNKGQHTESTNPGEPSSKCRLFEFEVVMDTPPKHACGQCGNGNHDFQHCIHAMFFEYMCRNCCFDYGDYSSCECY